MNWKPSVPPEPLEPLGRQFSIPHGVLDVLVPEVVLDRPGVVAVVRQFEAAAVAEHVGMDGKAHGGFFPGSREELAEHRPKRRKTGGGMPPCVYGRGIVRNPSTCGP